MTTIKELKEAIDTLPDDMEVEVLKRIEYPYASGTGWTELELGPFSDNLQVIGGTLYIGED